MSQVCGVGRRNGLILVTSFPFQLQSFLSSSPLPPNLEAEIFQIIGSLLVVEREPRSLTKIFVRLRSILWLFSYNCLHRDSCLAFLGRISVLCPLSSWGPSSLPLVSLFSPRSSESQREASPYPSGALESWNGMTVSSSNTNHTSICYCLPAARYSLKSSPSQKMCWHQELFLYLPTNSKELASNLHMNPPPCSALIQGCHQGRTPLRNETLVFSSPDNLSLH